MKKFTLPPWRKKQIKDKYRCKDKVIHRAVIDMEAAMKKAVSYIIDNSHGGRFAAPTLNEMYAVSDQFYRNVMTEAYRSSQHEQLIQRGRRRLAAKYNSPLVPKLKDLESIFRDRRFWPSMMKRSKQMTDRLRKAYMQKLERKFKEVVPKLMSGELSPEIAKERMMDAWDASKSRVETIFRTETTTYFGKTQTKFFESDPEIIGFLFDSIRDTSRTKWCSSRHGLIYRPGSRELTENTPALHWNCRSHLIALANTPYNRKLLSDPGRDPSVRSVEPLPPEWRR